MRHGHGDLHLGNIALIDGKPVLFDAIEFDPLVASGDVLYDLAFLLMDLVERGLPQAANIVLNRYLAETKRDSDLDALAALPFFMSMRAAIRAKVTAAKRDHADDKDKSDIEDSREGLFRARLATHRAAAAAIDRGRRAVRHRQIGAGPHAGGGYRTDARRGHFAFGHLAQDIVQLRRDRKTSRTGLHRRR